MLELSVEGRQLVGEDRVDVHDEPVQSVLASYLTAMQDAVTAAAATLHSAGAQLQAVRDRSDAARELQLDERPLWTASAKPSLVHDALLAASCREPLSTVVTASAQRVRPPWGRLIASSKC